MPLLGQQIENLVAERTALPEGDHIAFIGFDVLRRNAIAGHRPAVENSEIVGAVTDNLGIGRSGLGLVAPFAHDQLLIADVDGFVGAKVVIGLRPQHRLRVLSNVLAVELGQQHRAFNRNRWMCVQALLPESLYTVVHGEPPTVTSRLCFASASATAPSASASGDCRPGRSPASSRRDRLPVRDAVIGQHEDAMPSRQVFEEGAGRLDICGIVVEARNQRDTDPNLNIALAERMKIVEDETVVGAGFRPVPNRIHVFEVIEQEVGTLCHFEEFPAARDRRYRRWCGDRVGGTREDSRSETRPERAARHPRRSRRRRRCRKRPGLARAHRPARRPTSRDPRAHGRRPGRPPRTTHNGCRRRDPRAAPPAPLRPSRPGRPQSRHHSQATVGTDHQNRGLVDALGVVTPAARERAALEKDGGPDARSVVHRTPLDVEDPAFRGSEFCGNCVRRHIPQLIR